MRIPIRYITPWRWLLAVCLIPARSAYIRVDGGVVKIRMGWAFRANFACSLVQSVTEHRPVVSIGVHGWKGRWLVNGAHRPIAVIRLSAPVRSRVVGFPVEVHEILVSVDDRNGLRTVLGA